ncbi:hypothetical protein BDW62DRAFT_90437 [Aspergillus aurantiobrunneus]
MPPKQTEKGLLSAAYEQITAPEHTTIVRSILVFGRCRLPPQQSLRATPPSCLNEPLESLPHRSILECCKQTPCANRGPAIYPERLFSTLEADV